MIKIGIVTFWKSYNYGAFLQAYALQTFLERNMNASVHFIDYRKTVEYDPFNLKEVTRPFLHREENESASYDMIICGSDVIWDLTVNDALQRELFFGKVPRKYHRLIAFSASIGCCQRKNFLPFHNLRLAAHMINFDRISVRDDTTLSFAKLFKKDVIKTADPTFLIPWDIKPTSSPPYIFVYGYAWTKDEKLVIRKYAEKHGLPIICSGVALHKSDRLLNPDPFTWLSTMSAAEFVFTSTFHGTVFSLLLKKQFLTFDRGSAKINQLLNDFDLYEKNQKRLNAFRRRNYSQTLSLQRQSRIITQMRKVSQLYLQQEFSELLS